MKVGEHIKEIRFSKGLTQIELSERNPMDKNKFDWKATIKRRK